MDKDSRDACVGSTVPPAGVEAEIIVNCLCSPSLGDAHCSRSIVFKCGVVCLLLAPSYVLENFLISLFISVYTISG